MDTQNNPQDRYDAEALAFRQQNPHNPAFPVQGAIRAHGLTKREYFAGLAMQGMAAYRIGLADADDIAKRALDYADALLAELAK